MKTADHPLAWGSSWPNSPGSQQPGGGGSTAFCSHALRMLLWMLLIDWARAKQGEKPFKKWGQDRKLRPKANFRGAKLARNQEGGQARGWVQRQGQGILTTASASVLEHDHLVLSGTCCTEGCYHKASLRVSRQNFFQLIDGKRGLTGPLGSPPN